jgi:hypothetical protein
MKALETLLSLERSTSKAMAYSEWETPPEIHIEENAASGEISEATMK